eukprot:7889140-Lingulodinium_polyedra.AAC.1
MIFCAIYELALREVWGEVAVAGLTFSLGADAGAPFWWPPHAAAQRCSSTLEATYVDDEALAL